MFGFPRRQRQSGSRALYYRRPACESLEGRICPSAATIVTFWATPQTGQSVLLSGQVMDEQPGTVQVNFSGVITGSVTPNAMGSFQTVLQASSLGTVTAVAQDAEGLYSAPVSRQITSALPSITNLNVVETTADRMVIVSGTVQDETPGGRVVTLSGVVSGTAVTAGNGSFSVTLQASGLGTVTATTMDPWGQQSPGANKQLTSAAPTISDYVVETSSLSRTVIVSGKVNDAAPGGRTVTISGVASGTLTTNADGTFSGEIAASHLGTVSAVATDPWGQQSPQVFAQATNFMPTLGAVQIVESGGAFVTVSGVLTDEYLLDQTIHISGIANGTAVTDGTGGFSVVLPAASLGQVSVSMTDVWGQASNTEVATLTSAAPTIVNFTAQSAGNLWVFSGTVLDEKPDGLSVVFGGLLAGQAALVTETGTFSIAVYLAPGTEGTVTAFVTDWWGQVSETVEEQVDNR